MTDVNRVARVGVACILWRYLTETDDDSSTEALLIRRKGSHGAGTWTVPGGWVEFGETTADAVIREIEEEVGIVVGPGDLEFLGHTEDVALEGKHSVSLWYQAGPFPRSTLAKNQEPDKIAQMAWVADSDPLPSPLFSPFLKFVTGDAHETGQRQYWFPTLPLEQDRDGDLLGGGSGWPGSGVRGDHLRKRPDPVIEEPGTLRGNLLKIVNEIIHKDRNNTYGPPTQDFQRTANILTAMGFTFVDSTDNVHDLKPHHVALIMIALKLSRGAWQPNHMDTWVDIAGYAACGWECVSTQGDG